VRMAMDLRVMQPLRFPLPSRTLAVCSEQCNSAGANSRVAVIGAGRRRRRDSVVRAAKSGGSVDAPNSSASTSTSSEAGPTHLDLLERMTQQNPTYMADGSKVKTIREQLSNEVEAEDEQEVTISLGIAEPEIAPKELTIHQKRNIRRQDYLNKVSERNDAPFFATVAAFVLIPPICILGYAVATGYVDLFP
jgi:hypothetical protein